MQRKYGVIIIHLQTVVLCCFAKLIQYVSNLQELLVWKHIPVRRVIQRIVSLLTSTGLNKSNFCIRVKNSHGMQPEGIYSTMTKVKIAKDIHLQMRIVFDI